MFFIMIHRLAVTSDKVYQLLVHGLWFFPGTPASSTTKIGPNDIAEILLKMALNSNHCLTNENKTHLLPHGYMSSKLRQQILHYRKCSKILKLAYSCHFLLKCLYCAKKDNRHIYGCYAYRFFFYVNDFSKGIWDGSD
jgi:hypothetical protein